MTREVGQTNEQGEVVVELIGDIPITAEGKARARAKRLAVNSRRTPERLNAMRAKIGMPPVANA